MPLITDAHDSLPYVDNEPTPAEREAAQALITAELQSSSTSTSSGEETETTAEGDSTKTHPLLPPSPKFSFSPPIQSELSRIESKQPLTAIDLTRYEAQDPPPPTTPHSDEDRPELLTRWREALSRAYTSHAYLTGRQTNLSLLEQFGKNAWLIGNAQLEDILRDLEREVAGRKEEIDRVVVERRNRQEEVAGEIRMLEEGWRKGVGRVLETEVAAEAVRREILERRRSGVASAAEARS
ncbi:Pre-mRNA-splicing factor SPF27 [Xylogone sp. PMI_703]|nr:Pre-mRNA-splicing factor SPF27 [Xylogone sp. PMI_703]